MGLWFNPALGTLGPLYKSMEYLVVGADGKEYGPANLQTLTEWVKDGRVHGDTTLKEFSSGRTLPAGSVAELFPATVSAPPLVQGFPRGGYETPPAPGAYNPPRQQSYSGDGSADLWWSIFRSVLALVLFFVFRGIGLIVGIYGMVYAVRAQQAGHRFGMVAIIISGITLALLAVGWYLRMSGSVPAYR